jgi:hypothetical protein
MLLSPPAAQLAVDRTATQRLFNDFAIELTRHDVKLEDMVRSGNTVGNGWGDWFDNASRTLLQGRDAYAAINPRDTQMVARLGENLLDLASNGGRIASAEDRRATLGRGWSSVLDSTIASVQEAASRLYNAPNPGNGGSAVADASRAAELVRRSIDTIRTLPINDRGSESTKATRLAAYDMNMQAQRLIEPHFNGSDQWFGSQLRSADRLLTDANWQLARTPSPDGRFNGVDVRGALRDTQSALDKLDRLSYDGDPAPQA